VRTTCSITRFLGMPRLGAQHVREQADARAAQRAGVQGVDIARGRLADAQRRDRIARVVARHHLQQACGVAHRAGDGADLVLREAVGHDAGAADQAARGPHAYQAAGRGRRADRLPGVAAGAEHGEAGREGRAGTAAGAAGAAREVVGVAHLAAQAADRHAAARELLQVGLGQQQRTGRAQALHHEGVAARLRVAHRDVAAGGGQVVRVEVVLQDHRDAVQRPDRPAGGVRVVEMLGLLQRLRVHGQHGAQRRALAVVGRDAVEATLHQRARRQPPFAIGGMEGLDGGLLEREIRGGGRVHRPGSASAW
jgi:hypothetical protein